MKKKSKLVSLAPLTFDQALSGLMQVKPDKAKKAQKKGAGKKKG